MVALIFVILGCKKSAQPVAEKAEIDFSQSKVFTISELSNSKTLVPCSTTPYWENKPLSIQGYIFAVNINKRSFTLFSDFNYSASSTSGAYCEINPADSSAIYDVLYKNLDKKCYIKTTCKSGEIYVSKCEKLLIPMLMSVNDIEFK